MLAATPSIDASARLGRLDLGAGFGAFLRLSIAAALRAL
jgi:hypothetical protein